MTPYDFWNTSRSGSSEEETFVCHAGIADLDFGASTVSSLLIIIGSLFCFLGFYCFKMSSFLIGFVCAAAVVYIVCVQENFMPLYGNLSVSLCSGAVCGLVTLFVHNAGVFMIGFHAGLLSGSLFAAAVLQWYSPANLWIVLGVLLSCGLTVAMISLLWQRITMIFGTSLCGSAVVMVSIDYFVEDVALLIWFLRQLGLNTPQIIICWYSWIVLSTWPVTFMFGFALQMWTESKRFNPSACILNSSKQNWDRIRQEQAHVRQKKFWYLYQVRNAHGDALSQDYIQSYQRKNEPTQSLITEPTVGENSTLHSDDTHMTILPPDQTQLVSLPHHRISRNLVLDLPILKN